MRGHEDEFDVAPEAVPDPALAAALDAAHSWLEVDGVEGVGQGATEDGRDCIVVMVSMATPELEHEIPTDVGGIPVEIMETGPLQAQ